jgi:hypothetical protein
MREWWLLVVCLGSPNDDFDYDWNDDSHALRKECTASGIPLRLGVCPPLGCAPVGMGWPAGALSFTGRASGDRIHIVCIPILGRRRYHCDVAAAGEWLFILTSSRRLVGLGRLESAMIHAVALADRRLQGEC